MKNIVTRSFKLIVILLIDILIAISCYAFLFCPLNTFEFERYAEITSYILKSGFSKKRFTNEIITIDDQYDDHIVINTYGEVLPIIGELDHLENVILRRATRDDAISISASLALTLLVVIFSIPLIKSIDVEVDDDTIVTLELKNPAP